MWQCHGGTPVMQCNLCMWHLNFELKFHFERKKFREKVNEKSKTCAIEWFSERMKKRNIETLCTMVRLVGRPGSSSVNSSCLQFHVSNFKLLLSRQFYARKYGVEMLNVRLRYQRAAETGFEIVVLYCTHRN